MGTQGRIAIFGTGSVGGYIGGRLAVAGGDVVFIGRERMRAALSEGLHLTDYRGADLTLPEMRFVPDVSGADWVLVCVKSADTSAAAEALRPSLAPGARVISFQNGVGNAAALSEALGRPVLAGMVAFNVVREGARFHQGTEGDLHIAADPALPLDLFARAGLPLQCHADMAPVLWAKLMLNLNNAVNALSGLPLRAQLSQRGYRRCLALAQDEVLDLCARAGQPLARLAPLPPRLIPQVLRLTDPLFRAIAGRMLRIDPQARSSMADDLALGRATEVDWINGEVVRLAARLGRPAPVNDALTDLVHSQEGAPAPIAADRLLALLQQARAAG
jgi:2-dehydropantoate 2-reductase